jgi:hypothetical protein
MLEVLCGRVWDSNGAYEIFEEIEAEDSSTYYSPSEDFPFLAKRLLEIQRYVQHHRPRSILALWYDRRNSTQWWTFWVGDLKFFV